MLTRRQSLIVLLMVLTLSACTLPTPMLEVEVTRFKRWGERLPAIPASYRLVTEPDASLELRSHQDQLRARLGPLGWVEAREGELATFEVRLLVSRESSTATRWVRGPEPLPMPRWVWVQTANGPRQVLVQHAPLLPAPAQAVPVTVWQHELQLIITESGERRFESRARLERADASVLPVVGVLLDAALQEFPNPPDGRQVVRLPAPFSE
jgi:hypothetical protein